MEMYYYIPNNEKENALTCGIKLSVKADKKVLINGYTTPCISALLTPKDDMPKYKSDQFSCLKIDLKPRYCYIADKSLHGIKETEDLYLRSIIPLSEYVFGTYRNPECLVICTILPENINPENKVMGSPILYNSSEEMYLINLIQQLRENHKNFDETILNLFFDKLAGNGQLKKLQNGDLMIFTGPYGEVYTVKTGKIGGQDELYKHKRLQN